MSAATTQPTGIAASLAHLFRILTPAPKPPPPPPRFGYLVACHNNPNRALALCLGCSEEKARRINLALSFDEWCQVYNALNDGDSASVDRIIGLQRAIEA